MPFMAYAKPGEDSDVYVWSDGKELNCSACSLYDGIAYVTSAGPGGAGQMLSHLREHAAAGHQVPVRALARLEAEAAGRAAASFPG